MLFGSLSGDGSALSSCHLSANLPHGVDTLFGYFALLTVFELWVTSFQTGLGWAYKA